jgi:hypothetical protein
VGQQNAAGCVLLALDKTFFYEALRDPDPRGFLEQVAGYKEANPFYSREDARAGHRAAAGSRPGAG